MKEMRKKFNEKLDFLISCDIYLKILDMKKQLIITTAIFAITVVAEPYLKKEEREEHVEKEVYSRDFENLSGGIVVTGYTGTTTFTYH